MAGQTYKVGDLSKLLSSRHTKATQGKKNKKLEAMFSEAHKLKMHAVESDHSDGSQHPAIETKPKHIEAGRSKRKQKKVMPEEEVTEAVDSGTSVKKSKRQTVEGHPEGYCPPPGIVHEALAKQKKPKKRKSVEDEENPKRQRLDTEDDDTPTRVKKKKRDKSKDPRTVFVGNLPLTIKKKKLYKMFKEYGEIENIRYRCVPPADPKVPKRVIAIKQDFHPERNNFVAYVCFKDAVAARKALKCNGREIDKLHIRVDMASQDKAKDIKRSVFVGNLPFDIEEEAVRIHFEECGTVENVRIIRDRKTGLGKGFCYVQFQTKDEASLALKLNESQLCKRQLRVIRCQENPDKSIVAKEVDKSGKKFERKSYAGRKTFRGDSPSKKSDKGRFKDKPSENRRHRPHHPSNIRSSSFRGTQIHRKDKKKLKNLKKNKKFHTTKDNTLVTGSGSSKTFAKTKKKHIKFN